MSKEQTSSVDIDALQRATEQLIETTPAAGATQEEPPPAEPQQAQAELTPDEIDYQEALAALKAEQTAPAVTAPPKPEIADKPAETPPQEGQPTEEAKPGVVIPKARFDEVLRERDEAKSQAAYLKGIVDANKEMRTQPTSTVTEGKTAPPAKTIPEILAAIDAVKLDLAKKYDDGELTYSQLMAEQVKLDNQAFTIREESLRINGERITAEARDAAKREAIGEKLDDHAVRMDQEHPSLLALPQDGNAPEWGFLREKAVQELAKEGVVLRDNDSRSMMLFRERMATLADRFFPVEAAPAQAVSQQPPTVLKPSLGKQRLAKIETSHQQPPDTGRLGSSGTKQELTDSQILGMSDDQIAALPDATRARIKGMAA